MRLGGEICRTDARPQLMWQPAVKHHVDVIESEEGDSGRDPGEEKELEKP